MKLGAVDVEYTTRVLTPQEAWTFIMARLEEGELLEVKIVAQEWRHEDDDEWRDTLKVSVLVRKEDG